MSFVLDNSVAMRWFFGDGTARELAYAGAVLDAMKAELALVPSVWGLEVANVLSRAEARGLVTEARSEGFLALLRRLDIQVDSATPTHALESTLQLARRFQLSAYDASYLDLALRERLPLASLDRDLLKAAKRAGVARFVAP